MKRSTIILIIFLIILSALPIILIKIFSSHDLLLENMDGIEASIKNSEGAVKYILIDENDSMPMDIHITTMPPSGHQGLTRLNGIDYERDTLLLSNESTGKISLAYEEKVSLIIENRNRQAVIHLDKALVEKMIISSCGEVNIVAGNVGLVLVTDSMGIGQVNINSCNIGTLVSSRVGNQQIDLNSSNVGRWVMGENSSGYTYENCNVGLLVTGGKKEVVKNSNHSAVKVTVDSEKLIVGPEQQTQL